MNLFAVEAWHKITICADNSSFHLKLLHGFNCKVIVGFLARQLVFYHPSKPDLIA
jgi:hypothetical protein